MILSRIILVTALLLPSAATAADQDNRKALAEELVSIMQPEKMVNQTMEQVSAVMKQQMQSMDIPASMKAETDRMAQEMMAYVKEKLDWSKLKPQYVDMYADVFTEDELRQVVTFYKSPGGQAFLNKTPQLMQRSMAMMQGVLSDLPQRMQEMAQKIKNDAEATRDQPKQ